ncbi:MAG: TlpA family protein disulfide reductase, partial [Anaerolineales bacterium]|nr:TlpA family protein disulfide reductase [Anaerolineales bacterium]
ILALGLKRAQQGTVQVGDQIPDFKLSFFESFSYAGKFEVNYSDLRGKVVVINFWASWCKPCEQEATELEQAWLYYEPRNDVIFLGVDYVDTETEANLYLKKYGITYPNGPDLGTRISQLFRIKGVPETYFIDKEGELKYIQVGPLQSVNQIHTIVDPLLGP